ncbi:MAG: LysM peptidoglycan-binding domain-containing protein [Bacteroidaceae bacterium]|nr:LysM peptidoglycan-binding domain-containing protein [Bacteroidaceae bacterium]
MNRIITKLAIATCLLLVSAFAAAQESVYTKHTAQQGETLYRIAVNNGISVQDIYRANPGLEAQGLKVGQTINIPRASTVQEVPLQDLAAVTRTDLISKPAQNSPYKAIHKVEKRETIYRICRNYGITQDEFLQANPEYRYSKLRVGVNVNIPYSESEKAARSQQSGPSGTVSTVPAQTEPQETVSEPGESFFSQIFQDRKDDGVIRAALIMPFVLNGPQNTDQKKMVEFYQGVLMAIEELKQQGTSIELQVYDSGAEGSDISDIINRQEMQDIDIIFGPRYSGHIAQASAFAMQKKIPLVLPMNSTIEQVYTNPYIFQLNTAPTYYMAEVYNHFFRQFSNPNVIIIDAKDNSHNTFIEGLPDQLKQHGASYVTVVADTATSRIIDQLQPDKQNIFIINSSAAAPLNKMLPVLQLVERQKDPDIETCLFGYPEYQIYSTDHLDEFYEIDTWFYSWFYTNNLLQESVDFNSRFRRSFSRQMLISYPSFASYGYDMASFFLNGMAKYGDRMIENLDRIESRPVQMGFKFSRQGTGGYINDKIFFIHLANDCTVSKKDFDK